MRARTNLAPALVVSVALLVGACGSPAPDASAPRPPGGGGGSSPDGRCPAPSPAAAPDTPVSSCPSETGGGRGKRFELTEPRPGMASPVPAPWEKATPRGPKTLLVRFWSGVEPCYVLDRVEVEETDERVRITLFVGSDPEADAVACIELARLKAVRVSLEAPLGDRKVVDGAG
jgi:hypothetical protein